MNATRYEQIMSRHSSAAGDLPAAFAAASRAARAAVPAATERQAAIRDVSAGVAAPALAGFIIWMYGQARARGLQRLRFLSRDGQVLCEMARRLATPARADLDLEYVYSSRLAWSLAATDPAKLPSAEWLFNSFMKSNAADLCARLGIPYEHFVPAMAAEGVSPKPDDRADDTHQMAALRRFLARDEVTAAVLDRIGQARDLLLDYARQHHLADERTGLVDAGWTGRMIGSMIKICEQHGMTRPHVLLWGHEPRASGWTDPDYVAAYMYNTARPEQPNWRVADVPFLIETFCMGDHGIVSGYARTTGGRVEATLQSPHSPAADEWGSLNLHRQTLYAFADALDWPRDSLRDPDDVRPLLHELLDAFWLHPSKTEAAAWGSYSYDSDPAGTAARRLARPFNDADAKKALARGEMNRDDRAWLAGSLALSSPAAKEAWEQLGPRPELSGAPATD